jgi:uncharacterized damage-inducible protein DinB
MSERTDELLEVWRTNHRITLRLLGAVSDEGLLCSLSKRGGRSVGRQFAHLHDVRAMQLEARAKALAAGIRKFASKDEPARADLVDGLEDSARRIEDWIRYASAGVPGIRTFKRGVVQQVAYFVAHESHHRGSILLTLKVCGHPVERTVRDALWGDWDRSG